MYPYRVFLSYSHLDLPQSEVLKQILIAAGVTPMWDRDLTPGSLFSEQILNFIKNAHVFMPVLTKTSVERPWLNQEIGFAAAMGKPILPVTVGVAPLGIITGVQAVQLREDLGDAGQRLTAECFAELLDAPTVRTATYECTDDNVRRAQMLAEYADSVSALKQYGRVRQRASLTTFQMPTQSPKHPIWNRYFAGNRDNRLLFQALSAEREALNKHARRAGCQLILDPVESLEAVYRAHGPGNVQERIKGLLAFLTDDRVNDVVVAMNDDPERYSSLTLVGDWFCSEAVTSAISSSQSKVLKEAYFTRHHQTVRQEVRYFDLQMDSLLSAKGWTERASRSRAVAYLQDHLELRND